MPRRAATLLPFGSVALIVFVALALSSFTDRADAFSTGQVRHSGSPQVGGATCASCHTDGDTAATVSIALPSSVQVGQSVAISVTVNGGPGVVAGFNAATDGLIGLPRATDSATQVTSDEVTHTAPLAMSDGQATFTFEWTAPAEPGTVTWYASGVSANDNGRNTGDSVAATSAAISVEAAPTPTPTPGDTSLIDAFATTPTPTPVVAGGTDDGASAPSATSQTPTGGGVHGFGMNPQLPPAPAGEAVPTSGATTGGTGLAATGGSATAATSVAFALFASGAVLIVAARRGSPRQR